MNHAVIDLGSNSVRLSVYEYRDGQIAKVFSRKEIVGLAGYVSKGVLDLAGVRMACDVLNAFKHDAVNFVERGNIHLFATASLRNISNRDEVVAKIAEETTLAPDVLDGNEEEALGFAGASRFTVCDNGVMIDIGGASTELVLFKEGAVTDLVSLPIGCLNLSLDYVGEVIPNARELRKIKAEIKERFASIGWGKNNRGPLMVGIGGTLRAVAKLSRVLFDLDAEANEINAEHVKVINKRLKTHDGGIYHTVAKHIPERLLTLSPGVAILNHAIKTFGTETIRVSKYGLREGYLVNRVLKVGGGEGERAVDE